MTVEKCETVAEIVAYRAYERAMRTPGNTFGDESLKITRRRV